MNVTDPIADMLTRIRNASAARHKELTLPSSRVKREIARILADEGFIESYETLSTPESVQEQLVYPEIDYDKIDRLRGLEISIVTTAKTDEEGRKLLELLGMPFQSN